MIRLAKDGDYSAVESLWLELNKHHSEVEPALIRQVPVYMEEQAFRGIIESSDQDILVFDEGTIRGAAWVLERKHQGGQAIEIPIAFIQEICVSDSSRGLGIGRKLMQAIESWAKQRGLKLMELNVWSQNQSAVRFYEELGYRKTRYEMSKSVV
ncbi:MAG: GNAT family N-acetyltransferase [Pseudomonadota bacterium]